MIKRVKQSTELMVKLDLDLDSADNISIRYYTDEDNSVTKNAESGLVIMDGELYAILTSEDTENFAGVLRSECTSDVPNDAFPDGKQKLIVKQMLNIYFYE